MQAEHITIIDNTAAFRARLNQTWLANPFDNSLLKKIILMRTYFLIKSPKGKL